MLKKLNELISMIGKRNSRAVAPPIVNPVVAPPEALPLYPLEELKDDGNNHESKQPKSEQNLSE
jgi:hypothetical protein